MHRLSCSIQLALLQRAAPTAAEGPEACVPSHTILPAALHDCLTNPDQEPLAQVQLMQLDTGIHSSKQMQRSLCQSG